MPKQNQQQWFETCLGQYLLEREQSYFDQEVMNVFGYNAMQIGFTQHDFLRTNRMPLQFCADTKEGATLLAVPDFLPIESNSIDLILLPHVLEFSSNPHQILREVQRVLVAEGQVIICGFNPRSLWGARQWFGSTKHSFPWNGNFISLPRLKDWLTLLDFEMTAGRLSCYAPPFSQEKWLRRFKFMEFTGDRWWPISGGVYFLQAIKRIHGMRVIKPAWKDVLTAKRRMAPVANKLNGNITERKARDILTQQK
ncbi:MAG: methyltransferase domain-containing protein [Nitrosomonadales bacterium]|jgi:SAM-dependent methyltransferase|nr:MAG: methyltransferase domain-containing protein [Nitrosomonadales bacterium]